MTIQTLTEAIQEAERFIEKAKAVRAKYESNRVSAYFGPCKEAAAARRASMDLTRALANMRRFS